MLHTTTMTIHEYFTALPAFKRAGVVHKAQYANRYIYGDPVEVDNSYSFTVDGSSSPVVLPAATPITVEVADPQNPLQAHLARLAQARIDAETAAKAFKASETKWLNGEGQSLKTIKSAAEKHAQTLHEDVWALGVLTAQTVGKDALPIGIEVQEVTHYEYSPDEMRAWALTNAPVLLEINTGQTPVILSWLLNLLRLSNRADVPEDVAALLAQVPSFLALNTRTTEQAIKAGIYEFQGIPGKTVKKPETKVSKDLSHLLPETV